MPEYTWFICTLGDAKTNEFCARIINPENAQGDMLCEDGFRRNLWQCDSYEAVDHMIKNKQKFALTFHVFRRKGTDGAICRVDFLERKKRKQKVVKPKALKTF